MASLDFIFGNPTPRRKKVRKKVTRKKTRRKSNPRLIKATKGGKTTVVKAVPSKAEIASAKKKIDTKIRRLKKEADAVGTFASTIKAKGGAKNEKVARSLSDIMGEQKKIEVAQKKLQNMRKKLNGSKKVVEKLLKSGNKVVQQAVSKAEADRALASQKVRKLKASIAKEQKKLASKKKTKKKVAKKKATKKKVAKKKKATKRKTSKKKTKKKTAKKKATKKRVVRKKVTRKKATKKKASKRKASKRKTSKKKTSKKKTSKRKPAKKKMGKKKTRKKTKKKTFSFSGKLVSNPFGGKMGKVKQYLKHDSMEATGLVLGGMAHTGVNDLVGKLAPNLALKLDQYLGPFAGSSVALLAGVGLGMANKKLKNGKLEGLVKGLIGAGLVGYGATAYEKVISKAMPASTVAGYNDQLGYEDQYQMGGVDAIESFDGVDAIDGFDGVDAIDGFDGYDSQLG